MFSLRSVSLAVLGAGLASAFPTYNQLMKRSPMPMMEEGKWIVERQTGEFQNQKIWAFNQSNTIPEGLSVSNYNVGGSPFTHGFSPENAVVEGGYLELTVPGGQSSSPIMGGEIATDISNILYASVRTVAILSEPAGVCNGMFFYKSDTQETDIEWLSDPQSQSNQGKTQVWFTNQDENGDGQSTHNHVDPPAAATSTEHEYRIDWTEGNVAFFIDGVQQWQTSEDVPNVPGPWIWNNWSNGDKGWSAGPPAADAVFKIKEIQMYYNTA